MNHSEVLKGIIETVAKEGGSDIHFSANNHPIIRVNDVLIPILKDTELTSDDTLGILTELLTPEEKKRFLDTKEVDFSYRFNDKIRFRGNAFFQKGSVSIALRLVQEKIRTLEELGLPPVLTEFTKQQQGFFLVVGPVGQGKTTTLASLIELINQERTEHIVTIEDPIEYMFAPKKSLINQREVKVDTNDFETALVAVLRQDVDVIMIGEMRGIDTMSAAVTAAETGHLVFSTLHTNNAAQTVDRIIDSFPAAQQQQIRLQLAGSLLGILSQRLIPSVSGGLVPAVELLINNVATSNLIREHRTHELNTVIETSSREGMIDMNRSLADLVRKGEITTDNAFSRSLNPKVLKKYL